MNPASNRAPTKTVEQPITPHSRTAKILHWGFILVFAYGLAKQLDDVEELEDFGLLQNEMIFASVFLIVLLARFAYMRATRLTALPSSTDKSAQRTKHWARAVHLAMYASMALIAASGLCIGGLYWTGTKTGLAMDIALTVHEIAVYGSYLLIAGHVSAALWHRNQRDGIWNAMVPIWQETPRK